MDGRIWKYKGLCLAVRLQSWSRAALFRSSQFSQLFEFKNNLTSAQFGKRTVRRENPPSRTQPILPQLSTLRLPRSFEYWKITEVNLVLSPTIGIVSDTLKETLKIEEHLKTQRKQRPCGLLIGDTREVGELEKDWTPNTWSDIGNKLLDSNYDFTPTFYRKPIFSSHVFPLYLNLIGFG